ncbi:transmembrane protein 255A isoform X1 [Bufo gargarizans]|uniref:transmembrane protein 255A isoform X1 n=2 Tax=Bufo gargarizans TaxID=30331 RepID=UPI001CF446BB|nr:transmembrane protein 255A isoform X1 [Bufo gargarizans]
MLTQQASQRTEIPAADSTGSFNKRRRNSIFVTVTLFLVSILILTLGLAATTRTENVTVGGYYPGVILGFGSMLGIIGSNLIENKRQMLVASIVFISFGVIAAFCCAIVDGVFAARHLDLRPIYAGRCRYFPSAGDDHATDATEVTCQMPTRGSCSVKIKSSTCYCCELYNCGRQCTLCVALSNNQSCILGGWNFPNTSCIVQVVKSHRFRAGISGLYYEYIDVASCDDVVHLYHLLWSVTILNIVGLFLGIITAAVLGGFKDMNPTIPAISCIVETPRPTVQYNTRPPVPSYNTYYHSTPHLPPYTAYDLQHSTVFPASTPSGLSDDPNSTSHSGPSFMWPSTAPPRYSPPYFPPDEKPPPYTP